MSPADLAVVLAKRIQLEPRQAGQQDMSAAIDSALWAFVAAVGRLLGVHAGAAWAGPCWGPVGMPVDAAPHILPIPSST